jgi:lysophospholipase L1-like esterase
MPVKRLSLTVSLVLVAAPLVISAPAQATTAHRTTRVGAWTASLAGGGIDIVDRTVRMVVHTTVAGDSVRVRLSNLYGSKPLRIGAVDVAVQGSGGSAVRGSHHAVTFGGSAATTVPVGKEIAGDPLDMSVDAEEKLLVSVYLPGDAGPSSWHYVAADTTWFSAPGNFTAADTVADYPSESAAWYYLDGLDVESRTAGGTLVAFGDSITDGVGSSMSTNSRWPDDLARRLEKQPNGPALSVVDAGMGGNHLLIDTGTAYGTSALHRFAHDALGQPNVKAVILLEGINDIANPESGTTPTAQSLIHAYQTLIAQAHAARVRIYGGTLTPYQGSSNHSSSGEAVREAVNQWIRSSGAFDAVIDFDAAVAAPGNPQRLNPAYDSGDHLHLDDSGYEAMADAIDLTRITAATSG